jgi:predicted benzoate:H+ symporter BenE
MRRPHRRWHRAIWLVLPVLVAGLFAAALAVKPAMPDQTKVTAP